MKQQEHFPSTSNPEARYDAVVARGRSLERSARRRRTLLSTGVAALVIVVVGGAAFGAINSGDTPQEPASHPTTVAATPLRVSATTHADAVVIELDRSAAPVPAGTRACVHVRMQLDGPAQVAAAEKTACWSPGDGDAVTDIELTRTVGAEVGCAASADGTADGTADGDAPPVTLERPDGAVVTEPGATEPGATEPSPTTTVAPPASTPATSGATAALHHSFRFRLPSGLPAGNYVAEATGVVGTGDGCATSTPGDDEEVANATAAVTVG